MNSTLRSRFAALAALLLCGALAGCGGGGGGEPSATPPPIVEPPPAPPAPPLATSAYLLRGSRIDLCQIGSDGALSACADAGIAGFDGLGAMAVAGTHAYIAKTISGSAIIHCIILPTGVLSGCADTGIDGLEDPEGLTAHGSTLYIGDAVSPRVRKCRIRDDGSLEACSDAGLPDSSGFAAEEIRIVDATAYILHLDEGRISKCLVSADGAFSDCATAAASGLFTPFGLAIAGSHMYIANWGDNNIQRCTIADDRSLTDCVDASATEATFASPTQVAVRGSSVYITSNVVGVTHCTRTSEGFLTGCTPTAGPPEAVYNIVLR